MQICFPNTVNNNAKSIPLATSSFLFCEVLLGGLLSINFSEKTTHRVNWKISRGKISVQKVKIDPTLGSRPEPNGLGREPYYVDMVGGTLAL